MGHAQTIFPAQRRKGAKRCRITKRLVLRLCAAVSLGLVIVIIAFRFSVRANGDDVPALVAGRVRGLAAVGDRFDLRGVWLE